MRSKTKVKKAKRLWRLDPSKLMPGDVLLERAPTAKSLTIRGATGGSYSHALVWMGNTDFMESVGDGVRPMPYARIITADPNRWSLLRLDNNAQAAATAATYVRSHPFKGYNLGRAFASVLTTSGPARSTKLFCSQLVAVAYKSADTDLCPGIDASSITPADLQKRSILQEAPNPFKEITDPDELSAFAQFQDRDKALKGSSLDIERKASQEAFRAVKRLARKIPKPSDSQIPFPAASLGELIELLAHEKSPEGDACAAQLRLELSNRDYFDLLTPIVIELRSYIESQLAVLESNNRGPELKLATISRLDELSSGWDDTEQRYKSNAAACIAGYQRNRRELLMKLAAMYLKNSQSFDYLREFLLRSPTYSAHRASRYAASGSSN